MVEITVQYDEDYTFTEDDLHDKKHTLTEKGLTKEESEFVWDMIRERVEEVHERQEKEWSEDVKDGFTNLMMELVSQKTNKLDEIPDSVVIETKNGSVEIDL